jgi:hypothetical protein
LTVIINDLNDNIPKFGQYILDSLPIYNLIPVTQTLTTVIYENEIGPFFFNNIDKNVLIAYDLDLGVNARFIFQVSNSIGLTIFELNKYFLLDVSPTFINSVQPVQSSSNFNLLCLVSLDFETLDVEPIDNFTLSGVSVKAIKFDVS